MPQLHPYSLQVDAHQLPGTPMAKDLIRSLTMMSGGVWALNADHADAVYALALREERAALGTSGGYSAQAHTVGSTAIIPIHGTIVPNPDALFSPGTQTAISDLRQSFRAALKNPAVTAILFDVDSPGGHVSGVDEMSAEIFAARGVKNIGAVCGGGLMCSAAYYLASAARWVFASPSSLNGSIGVITLHFDLSGLYAGAGIVPTVITHGSRKADGNPYQKLTADARATLQKRVSDFGFMFEAAVARNRGISIADVRNRFGQGAVYTGHESRQRGLIDSVEWETGVQAMLQGQKGYSANARTAANIGNPGSLVRMFIESRTECRNAAAAEDEPNERKEKPRRKNPFKIDWS